MSDLSDRISKIEQGLKTFRMIGSGGAQVEGSFDTGYCITCPETTQAAEIPVVPSPPVTPTGACCIGENCSITTEEACLLSGGTYQGDNTTCSPNPCLVPVPGTCCTGDDCSIDTEEHCINSGGIFLGIGIPCTPNPCVAACCIDEECSLHSESVCEELGGEFLPDITECDPNPCGAPLRGCCSFGACNVMTEENCLIDGGIWHEEITACGPCNPCFYEPPGPAIGACCIAPELGGGCVNDTQTHCETINLGIWFDGLPCGNPDGSCICGE